LGTARQAYRVTIGILYSVVSVTIRDELMELPYKVISVQYLSKQMTLSVTLCAKVFCNPKDLSVLSSDKDFAQLQKFPDVETVFAHTEKVHE
jgi:hypothetical protein